jgi:hypothetical protein
MKPELNNVMLNLAIVSTFCSTEVVKNVLFFLSRKKSSRRSHKLHDYGFVRAIKLNQCFSNFFSRNANSIYSAAKSLTNE